MHNHGRARRSIAIAAADDKGCLTSDRTTEHIDPAWVVGARYSSVRRNPRVTGRRAIEAHFSSLAAINRTVTARSNNRESHLSSLGANNRALMDRIALHNHASAVDAIVTVCRVTVSRPKEERCAGQDGEGRIGRG